ncbi:hypothetical protein [Nocardioides speluncae]|uniref:hypothetical protein n=1 Tax=Nocardioides speluncae TaxID=2670337 RepID=UPI000D69B225|nr:hypothetical protein [Nocardioides speluncae]
MNGPASDDRRARTGTIALVLGAMSALALLAAVATAAVLALGEDDAVATDGSERPPSPKVPDPGFPGGQTIYGDRMQNIAIEVPAVDVGWTLLAPGQGTYFAGKDNDGDGVGDGDTAVTDGQAAIYQLNWCEPEEEFEQPYLASIGIESMTDNEDEDLRTANETVAKVWADEAAYQDDGVHTNKHSDIATESFELDDGTEAFVSRSVITVASADRKKCDAPQHEVSVLTLDAGEHLVSVVLSRDLGLDGSLSHDQAVELLRAVHVLK